MNIEKPFNTQKVPLNWTSIIFFIVTPLVGVLGTGLYTWQFGMSWWMPLLCLVTYAVVGLSITLGYHRYFSHKSFEAHPIVEWAVLLFGAMAFENSLLHWARNHRDHHRYVDTDRDPYNIKKGGWWAHILWACYKDNPDWNYDSCPDLTENKRVMWQFRWGVPFALFASFVAPALLGYAIGGPVGALGGLLWGGFLRVVIIHHTTFFVNSWAHMFGSRPYDDSQTARDNWLVALFTNGEGYHNFHHKFPSDFRNGIMWFQWDPTKWAIALLSWMKLVSNLNVTPPAAIEKAKLKIAAQRAEKKLPLVPEEVRLTVRARFEKAQQALELAADLWNEALAARRSRMAAGVKANTAWKEVWHGKGRSYRAHLAQARHEQRQAIRLLAESAAATTVS